MTAHKLKLLCDKIIADGHGDKIIVIRDAKYGDEPLGKNYKIVAFDSDDGLWKSSRILGTKVIRIS